MAALSTEVVDIDGLSPTEATPAGGGDTIVAGPRAFIRVYNGSGGSINVTVSATFAKNGLDLEDLVVAVPNGEAKYIGPIDRETFGNASGLAAVATSDQTSVTIESLRI